jgi:DNA topoisomerase IA
MEKMSHYKIGSPASISVILSTLKDAGFVTPEILTVSHKGKAFIESLPTGLSDFYRLMEFQQIEHLKNISHADKISLAQDHLSLLFANFKL